MAKNSEVIEVINRRLANALALTLNYRKYHWEMSGPRFRDLHLLFEELYNDVDATIDETAERARMLGGFPIHSPEQIREHATIEIAEPGQMEPAEMIRQAHANAEQLVTEHKEGIQIAEEHDDPGSADLFTRYVQIHEKHEWFLRELLEKGSQ